MNNKPQKIHQHPASSATVETLLRMVLENVEEIDSIVISVQNKAKPDADGLAEQYHTKMRNGDLAWHKWMIDEYLQRKLVSDDS